MTIEEEALVYYQLLQKSGRLRDVLLCEFRCPNGCLLLRAFSTPNGVAFYKTYGRHVSGSVSSVIPRSAEGLRRYDLDMGVGIDWDAAGTTANCDHGQEWLLSFKHDWLLRPGQIKRVIATKKK